MTPSKRRADLTAVETERAAQIKSEHEACLNAAQSAVTHAYCVGKLLIEVKARLKHGEYLPWVAANCQFNRRSAQVYTRIAAYFPDAQEAAHFSTLESALKEIASAASPPPRNKTSGRLSRARRWLLIAEAEDPRNKAYEQAAKLAAAVIADGMSREEVAEALGQSAERVLALV